MDITGSQVIAAPRQRVWDALNDPLVLKQSLPGCESVERTADNEFKVVMAAAIGPLRARFNGKLVMSDVQAPASCTMSFEGQGGTVGFGKGSAGVKLNEIDGQTELVYRADAQVGGKLAQVGSRLIDSVARKMADDFFKAFKAQLIDGLPATAAPAATTAAPAAVRSSAPAATAALAEKRPATVSAELLPKARAPVAAPAVVMVPGWWLGVAAVLGSVAALAGVVLAH